MNRIIRAIALVPALLACAPSEADPKGPEEDAPLEGALDSARNPTDHGPLTLGEPVTAELAPRAEFHAWTFELTADAAVTLLTGEAGDGEVDTVLYLYREGPRGWGSYLARNDDANRTLWSALSRSLRAGRYRVVVKGYDRRERGAFELRSECRGAGCPQPPAQCLFGATFRDAIAGGSDVSVSSDERLTSAAQLRDGVEREQVVLALRESTHDDVTTAEQAFARADGGEIRRVRLWDSGAQRRFVAFEYGAGDSSYGAIFAEGTTRIVAGIHDGDLAECTVTAGTCMLGRTYRELRDSALFEPVLSTVVTSPVGISEARAAQLLDAVRVAYEDATDVASALEAVDENEVNVLELGERATGRRFVVYEYGAGDNSYGAAYEGDTLTRVVVINDGDLYDCTELGAPSGARVGADCGETIGIECAEGLTCQGYVEARGAGKCAPSGSIAGEGASCSPSSACASEQLVCAGLTRGDSGICVPVWLRGSTGESWAIEIPDGPEGVLARTEIAYGLATVDMDVEIRALIEHPRPQDLRVTLTNPAGTEVVVFDGATSDAEPGYLELDGPVRGFSGDESVNGEWTLRVVDRVAGQSGSLQRWAVDITSRWD